MAFRSLYLWFAPWSKTYKWDVITWYSNYLYDEWFNSLSEEKQQFIIERRKQREKERKARAMNSLNTLLAITTDMMYRSSRGRW